MTSTGMKYRDDIWLAKPDGWGNAVVIGKNPAEKDENSPTLAKVKCLLNCWDFHMVTVVNAYAVRAPSASHLARLIESDHGAAIGAENDCEIADAVEGADLVIAAWGQPRPGRSAARYNQRVTEIVDLVGADRLTFVDRMTGGSATGYPLHPLRWAEKSKLHNWPRPRPRCGGTLDEGETT